MDEITNYFIIRQTGNFVEGCNDRFKVLNLPIWIHCGEGVQDGRRRRASLNIPFCFIYNMLEDQGQNRGAVLSRQMS